MMQRRIAERMKRRIKRDGPYLSIYQIRLLLNYPLPRDVCVLPATPYYYKGGPYLSITILTTTHPLHIIVGQAPPIVVGHTILLNACRGQRPLLWNRHP